MLISHTPVLWGTWQFWLLAFSLSLFKDGNSTPTKMSIALPSLPNISQPSYWSILESLAIPSVSEKARLDDPLVKSYLNMLANMMATALISEESQS